MHSGILHAFPSADRQRKTGGHQRSHTRLGFLARPVGLAFILVLAGTTPSFAQTQAPATTPSAQPRLDNNEMVQLQKARAEVLKENPDLKAEEEKLKAMHDSAAQQPPGSDPARRNAAFAEWKSYQKRMRTAMLKIDPTLEPIFAKLDSTRKHTADK